MYYKLYSSFQLSRPSVIFYQLRMQTKTLTLKTSHYFSLKKTMTKANLHILLVSFINRKTIKQNF